MDKYIDADHLKVEIEKHIKEIKDAAERFAPNMGFFDAKLSGIYDVMTIIDSLQQEQQEVDLEKEDDAIREDIISFIKKTLIERGIKNGKEIGNKWVSYLERFGKSSK